MKEAIELHANASDDIAIEQLEKLQSGEPVYLTLDYLLLGTKISHYLSHHGKSTRRLRTE